MLTELVDLILHPKNPVFFLNLLVAVIYELNHEQTDHQLLDLKSQLFVKLNYHTFGYFVLWAWYQ
tara:strand:+ start:297 stop:491 length:195 start_codon:yes stop_codon:yes gene_type:complete